VHICVHETQEFGTRLGAVPDLIEDIRVELFRLGVTHPTVPHIDAIGVSDRGSGNALLSGSPRGIDFEWFDEASTILERLRELPDNAGPERIRSEFARCIQLTTRPELFEVKPPTSGDVQPAGCGSR
jgi:hypothetical protein